MALVAGDWGRELGGVVGECGEGAEDEMDGDDLEVVFFEVDLGWGGVELEGELPGGEADETADGT